MAIDINIFELPNVRISNNILTNRPRDKYKYVVSHAEFKAVLQELVTKNPQWDFEFVHGYRSQDPDGQTFFNMSKVYLYAGKEHLGAVGIEYHGGERKVYVHNHRVAAERSRNQGRAFTKDPKRAITLVNKTFSRKSPVELMRDARTKVSSVVVSITQQRKVDLARIADTVRAKAGAFVVANEDRLADIFKESTLGMEVLDSVNKAATQKALVDEAEMMLNSLSPSTNTLSYKKSATVVVLQSSYVVHSNDTLSTYTNETLPQEFRGPLGLLKLTEAETLLPVGVRVSDDVYLIVLEEGEKDDAQV